MLLFAMLCFFTCTMHAADKTAIHIPNVTQSLSYRSQKILVINSCKQSMSIKFDTTELTRQPPRDLQFPSGKFPQWHTLQPGDERALSFCNLVHYKQGIESILNELHVQIMPSGRDAHGVPTTNFWLNPAQAPKALIIARREVGDALEITQQYE